jgi:hypothetical protein
MKINANEMGEIAFGKYVFYKMEAHIFLVVYIVTCRGGTRDENDGF